MNVFVLERGKFFLCAHIDPPLQYIPFDISSKYRYNAGR